MAKQRLIDTRFWDDNYTSNLDPIEKLLFLYFLTNTSTNICGIYEIPIKKISNETGIDKDMVLKIIDRFSKDTRIFYEKGWVCIKNFIKHQNQHSPQVQKGIEREIMAVPKDIVAKMMEYGYGIDTLSHLTKLNLTKLNLTGVATATLWDWKNYLEEMSKNPNKHIRIIAAYFARRGKEFSSREEVNEAIKRHLRAARSVSKFDRSKILQAMDKCEQMEGIEWTLETVLKTLTK